mgnify:CR=1 FL=1
MLGAEVVEPYSSDVRLHRPPPRWYHRAITTIPSAAAVQEGGVTAASSDAVLVLATQGVLVAPEGTAHRLAETPWGSICR